MKDLPGDVKEEIAYLLGMECYVYGFPLVLMDVTNAVLTATSKSGEYKAPINQFGRIRTYVSPDFKDVVRISVNSLWSFAVLDLDKEPIVVSHPDTKGLAETAGWALRHAGSEWLAERPQSREVWHRL